MDTITLTEQYFEVWNAHAVPGIQALHDPHSTLKDWDGVHGPSNTALAKGICEIWTNVPAIRIGILDVYTCSPGLACVANIKVIVDADTILKVCNVIEYDTNSLNVYLAT